MSLLAAAGVLSLLWRYAVRADLVRPDTDDAELAEVTERLTPGIAAYIVLVGLGLFLPLVAVLGYFMIAVYFLTPLKPRRRRQRPSA